MWNYLQTAQNPPPNAVYYIIIQLGTLQRHEIKSSGMPTLNNNCENFDQFGLLYTISNHIKNKSVVRLRFAGSLRKFFNKKCSQISTLCNCLMCKTAKNRKSGIKSLQNNYLCQIRFLLANEVYPQSFFSSTSQELFDLSTQNWQFRMIWTRYPTAKVPVPL